MQSDLAVIVLEVAVLLSNTVTAETYGAHLLAFQSPDVRLSWLELVDQTLAHERVLVLPYHSNNQHTK